MRFASEDGRHGFELELRGGRAAGRARRRRVAARPAAWRATSSCAACAARSRVDGRDRRSTASASAGTRGATPDWARIALDALARRVARRRPGGRCSARPAGGRREPRRGGASGRRCSAPDGRSRASPIRALSTTYDGDGHQRRAGLELWVGEDDDYPQRASGEVLCGSTLELGRAAARLRVLRAGTWRAARASAATTCCAPRVITALISDFGGVLTSPLLEAFASDPGAARRARSRTFGTRDGARAPSTHGEHPLFALERGEITEREFLARLERGAAGAARPARRPARRSAERLMAELQPNEELFDLLPRACGTRGLAARASCTNNVREWEPLWRADAPDRRDLRGASSTPPSSACASRSRRSTRSPSSGSAWRPRRARSSTTPRSTSTPRASWGCTRCGSATRGRLSRSLMLLLGA